MLFYRTKVRHISAVLGTIGMLPMGLISACGVAADSMEHDDYRRILREEYPMFTAQQLLYSADYFDAEGFVFGDLLVGDFNGDAIEDFGAALARVRSKAEAEMDEDESTRQILHESTAVVCTGMPTSGGSDEGPTFNCNYLIAPSLGGFEGGLAFLEISSEELAESEIVAGENCKVSAEQQDGSRTLALVGSQGGDCLSLFYPVPGSSSYRECVYCEY